MEEGATEAGNIESDPEVYLRRKHEVRLFRGTMTISELILEPSTRRETIVGVKGTETHTEGANIHPYECITLLELSP